MSEWIVDLLGLPHLKIGTAPLRLLSSLCKGFGLTAAITVRINGITGKGAITDYIRLGTSFGSGTIILDRL